mmetsp:Transcript_21118/g.21435  ORF Transcript_21118/g.21435 Transcript_21118/m.21435 type:complete len:141 (-) Transcript_21118:22-444(-)
MAAVPFRTGVYTAGSNSRKLINNINPPRNQASAGRFAQSIRGFQCKHPPFVVDIVSAVDNNGEGDKSHKLLGEVVDGYMTAVRRPMRFGSDVCVSDSRLSALSALSRQPSRHVSFGQSKKTASQQFSLSGSNHCNANICR